MLPPLFSVFPSVSVPLPPFPPVPPFPPSFLLSPVALPPAPPFPPDTVPSMMVTLLSVVIPAPPFPPSPGFPVAESDSLPPLPPVTLPPFTVGVMSPSIPAPPSPPLLALPAASSLVSAPLPPMMFPSLPTVTPAFAGFSGSSAVPIPAAPSGCFSEPSPPLMVPLTISSFVPGCSFMLPSFTNSSPGFASSVSVALSPVMVFPFKSIVTLPQVSGISTVWSMSFFTMTL